VVFLLEDDAEHAALVRVSEDQDVEGRSGDAVAVVLDVLDE
jgi:hypothetical protein